MAVGADNTGTATRESLMRARGYSEAAIASNGNGHRPEGDTPPPAPVDDVDQVEAVDPPESGPALCALDGCSVAIPTGRRRYCSPGCASEAERRRTRAKNQRAQERAVVGARVAVSATSPAPVDEHRRPSVGQLATEILAAGYRVEVTIDGAVLAARR